MKRREHFRVREAKAIEEHEVMESVVPFQWSVFCNVLTVCEPHPDQWANVLEKCDVC
jgi:hypothetical protein